jgi:hypothetical protein
MKLSKNFKIVYGIVAILFVVMFLSYKVSLNIWGAYTVGKTTDISTARGGTKVSYEFHINGKRYGGMITEPMRHENEGRPYFIHYLKLMPSINLLVPDKPADNCFDAYRNVSLDSIPLCK